MTDHEKTTVGALLRRRRLELGIPLEEIVAKTRIRRSYLEAIEGDNFEHLPGEAYLKGFLSNYARQLGLKPESVLRLWQEQAAPAAARKVEPSPPPPSVTAAPPTRRRKKLPSALLMLPVLALAGSLLWLAADRWPQDKATEPAPVPVLAPPQPMSPAVPAPPSAGDASSSPTAGETAQSEMVEKAPALPSIPSGGGVLRLVATGPVTIDLTVDNLPERRYELKAAAALSWKVGSSARITLDDPAAAQVWLGDEPIDFGGGSTVVLRSSEKEEVSR